MKHWGARMQTDTHRGYNGYLIESGRYRIIFGGDTAYTDAFRTVRSSRPVDLAIMPIGAYDPWICAHCNPEQALAMDGQEQGRYEELSEVLFALLNEAIQSSVNSVV